MARTLAGLCVILALLAVRSVAVAQQAPHVSTGPFTGTHETSARDAVDSALTHHDGADVHVLPALDFIAAAQRMGVDTAVDDPTVARIAQDQQLDFVVVGSMTHHGRAWVMHLRVLAARDATTVGTASWELRSPSEAADVRDEIWQQLAPYLLGHAPGDAVARLATPRPAISPVQVTGVPAASTLGFLTLTLGAGDSMRFWNLAVLGEMAARGYDNHGFLEAGGRATLLFRWAGDRAGIGVSVGGSLPVAITSHGVGQDGATTTLPTHAFEAWGGLAAAYRPPTGGWALVDVGVFDHSFDVDTTSLPLAQQLAPMSYLGLRAELEGALPLYLDASRGWELDLVFGGQFRVAGVGADIRSAFGDAPATTFAVGGDVGLAMLLDGLLPGLSVRATGELLRYRTVFSGRYRVGPASDSVDDYTRFVAAVSYSFGVRRAPRFPSR